MKKIFPILLTSSILAGTANGIDSGNVQKLRELVKNDSTALKGSINLNGNGSESCRVTIDDGVNYEFNDFFNTLDYLNEDGIRLTLYDFGNDGDVDGYSRVKSGISKVFEVSEIVTGNLEDIKFELSFSDRLNRMGDRAPDKVYGIHPDGDVVGADFATGELLKHKKDSFKKTMQETYDNFMSTLRNHYKPAKDAQYKGGQNGTKR